MVGIGQSQSFNCDWETCTESTWTTTISDYFGLMDMGKLGFCAKWNVPIYKVWQKTSISMMRALKWIINQHLALPVGTQQKWCSLLYKNRAWRYRSNKENDWRIAWRNSKYGGDRRILNCLQRNTIYRILRNSIGYDVWYCAKYSIYKHFYEPWYMAISLRLLSQMVGAWMSKYLVIILICLNLEGGRSPPTHFDLPPSYQ